MPSTCVFLIYSIHICLLFFCLFTNSLKVNCNKHKTRIKKKTVFFDRLFVYLKTIEHERKPICEPSRAYAVCICGENEDASLCLYLFLFQQKSDRKAFPGGLCLLPCILKITIRSYHQPLKRSVLVFVILLLLECAVAQCYGKTIFPV